MPSLRLIASSKAIPLEMKRVPAATEIRLSLLVRRPLRVAATHGSCRNCAYRPPSAPTTRLPAQVARSPGLVQALGELAGDPSERGEGHSAHDDQWLGAAKSARPLALQLLASMACVSPAGLSPSCKPSLLSSRAHACRIQWRFVLRRGRIGRKGVQQTALFASALLSSFSFSPISLLSIYPSCPAGYRFLSKVCHTCRRTVGRPCHRLPLYQNGLSSSDSVAVLTSYPSLSPSSSPNRSIAPLPSPSASPAPLCLVAAPCQETLARL